MFTVPFPVRCSQVQVDVFWRRDAIHHGLLICVAHRRRRDVGQPADVDRWRHRLSHRSGWTKGDPKMEEWCGMLLKFLPCKTQKNHESPFKYWNYEVFESAKDQTTMTSCVVAIHGISPPSAMKTTEVCNSRKVNMLRIQPEIQRKIHKDQDKHPC